MKKEISLKCPWLVVEGGTAEVLSWLIEKGQRVEIDQDIMLMLLVNGEEFRLPAPVDGIIISLEVEPGDIIEPDQVIAIIETI